MFPGRLSIIHKKWGIVFFAGAILMGLARIIAGIHWPVDILVGALIGILSAWFVCKTFKILYNKE
jgi:undecaprenyl-diphosphatase